MNNVIYANKTNTYNTTKLIQFKVDPDTYDTIKKKGAEMGLSANLCARHLMMETLRGNAGLCPELIYDLIGMYNMLEMPADLWNTDMHKNYKKGMKKIHDKLFCCQ